MKRQHRAGRTQPDEDAPHRKTAAAERPAAERSKASNTRRTPSANSSRPPPRPRPSRAVAAAARYHALLDALTQFVWTMDADGLADQSDPAWCAYTGQTAEEARGWGWLGAISGEERVRVRTEWSAAVNARRASQIEFRLRRADGSLRDFVTRVVPSLTDDGSVREWTCTSTDVTERRHTEHTHESEPQAVAAHTGELDAVFDAVADALAVYDAEGNIQRMNAAMRALVGVNVDPAYQELPLAERLARIHLRDGVGRALPREQWPHTRILRGEALGGAAALDIRIHTLDGRDLDLNVSGAPIRDKLGEISGAVVFYRDVTAHRSGERHTQQALHALLAMAEALVAGSDAAEDSRTLRETATRLAVLIRAVVNCRRASLHALDPETETLMPIGIVGMSAEMERAWWEEWNAHPPLESALGASLVQRLRAGEVLVYDLSQPPFDTVPNPYGIITVLLAPMRTGERLVGILALDHDSVRHIYTDDELALAGGAAKLAALVIERERLLAEREAARASALSLRVANQHMDEFLSIASHELRNPLTSIRASIQLAERRIRKASQQAAAAGESAQAQMLDVVLDPLLRGDRQTTLLDRLVGDLLDVSRMQMGRLELRRMKTDLAPLVREAVEQQRMSHPGRRIVLELPAGTALPVRADPDRVSQVVTNYLTNALKYSEDQAPVTVRLELLSDAARVTVRDEGPGIPAEQQPLIWERFHRTPTASAGVKSGLGLGLYISRNLVERHGGQVGVESVPGKGSTFWFTLPL